MPDIRDSPFFYRRLFFCCTLNQCVNTAPRGTVRTRSVELPIGMLSRCMRHTTAGWNARCVSIYPSTGNMTTMRTDAIAVGIGRTVPPKPRVAELFNLVRSYDISDTCVFAFSRQLRDKSRKMIYSSNSSQFNVRRTYTHSG